MLKSYYKNKKVLITGHTGFKGTWLCKMLSMMGAKVYGYSLGYPTTPNLFEIINNKNVTTKFGDISDYAALAEYYQEVRPEIVFHLAAQPLVREGYADPLTTYNTNVLGTVNILECVRQYGAKSFLNVTTDKVYDNIETDHYYTEDERLDGFDPYSNSKSCSELVTHCYVRSYPTQMCPVSTARAGNVIGGGDFAKDRIIPDCVRAATNNEKIILRNPNSIRPYQHVLEPLYAYLVIAYAQTNDVRYADNYNIGPNMKDCITTGQLAEQFCKYWGNNLQWSSTIQMGPHEANYLKLDNSKLKNRLGIEPLWGIEDAIEKVVEWTKIWVFNGDIDVCMEKQIRNYLLERGIEL